MDPLLIYGAYGYTGELIARQAAAQGLQPVLAGRDAAKTIDLAHELGLEHRVFSLDETKELARALAGMKAVLNCAGPFSATALPMAEACVRAGAHYMDITGEIEAIESVAALDAQAREAGVMLLPCVGADVVPSDCLAAHLKRRLPSACALTMAFQAKGKVSHGTAVTGVALLHKGAVVRRAGCLKYVPFACKTREIDFGFGPRNTMLIRWGDVATAWRSTGIPDIEVFMAAPKRMSRLARLLNPFAWIFGLGPLNAFLRARVAPGGPNAEERAQGAMRFWGEARDAAGNTVTSRLHAPEGYDMTVLASLHIARKVLAGEVRPGFATPALVYGPELVLELPGVSREDL